MLVYNTSDKKTDIISKIKSLLYNYDLTIKYAEAQIKLREEWMKVKKNKKKKKDAELYVLAKVEKERYLAFLEELDKERTELLDAVLSVCSDYFGEKAKEIFYLYYFVHASMREMVAKTNLTEPQILHIIKQLEDNLMYNVY